MTTFIKVNACKRVGFISIVWDRCWFESADGASLQGKEKAACCQPEKKKSTLLTRLKELEAFGETANAVLQLAAQFSTQCKSETRTPTKTHSITSPAAECMSRSVHLLWIPRQRIFEDAFRRMFFLSTPRLFYQHCSPTFIFMTLGILLCAVATWRSSSDRTFSFHRKFTLSDPLFSNYVPVPASRKSSASVMWTRSGGP